VRAICRLDPRAAPWPQEHIVGGLHPQGQLSGGNPNRRSRPVPDI